MQLTPFADHIWTYEGDTVNFYGFPFSTRMTVIKLQDGSLFVHSPEKINETLPEELAVLGTVKYLVSPNKLHHLFLGEWIEAYPRAIKYTPPGLAEKRKDIEFDVSLGDRPEREWRDEIDQLVFRGSPVMEEVVFFHRESSTLIVTDLVENFDTTYFKGWRKPLAKWAGILAPDGKMPADWRLSFMFGDKQKARRALDRMLAWRPARMIMSHGLCVREDATEFLQKSFAWLTKQG